MSAASLWPRIKRPLATMGLGAGSLRLRLIVAAVVFSAIAVAIAGSAMVILVNRHIERRVVYELRGHLDQLTARFALDGNDPDVRSDLADPRFDRPLSGLYWQIAERGEPKVRSRSLWDRTLPEVGKALDEAGDQAFEIEGPRRQTLIAVSRQVTLGHAADGGERSFSLMVAADRGDIDQLTEDFALEAAAFLAALVLFLAVAGWLQVTVGLRPLAGLREMVEAVRRGRAERLTGAFPDEVIPLVEEVNGLIDAQSRTIERARARAGDLAHGLKTPLAVIGSEARALRERGEEASAETIESEVIGMSRFVERQLARARIASYQRFAGSVSFAELAGRLVRAMWRLPRGDDIDWQIDVPADVGLALHREDADEIFGNLFDNARKFARSVVTVSARTAGDATLITIADDGPGVPESRREAVLLRGLRLDESVQGSGLGLSIVDDLVSSYGGTLALGARPGGGLQVDLRLPGGAKAADDGEHR
ncbi:MAG: HAMP domain-containing sensor histidine kinase [Ancalomicrobiaceae bacterium]|nr:HAMP domain-containing sensor histidine kinase [Ancalomicrobiaceae bacterium]